MSDPKVNKRNRKPLKVLIALVIVSLAGGAVWYFLIRKPAAIYKMHPVNLVLIL